MKFLVNEAYRPYANERVDRVSIGKLRCALVVPQGRRAQRGVASALSVHNRGGGSLHARIARAPIFYTCPSHSWPDDRLSAFPSPIGQERWIRADCV